MRQYLYPVLFAVLAWALSACEEYNNTFEFAPKVQFSIGDTTLFESSLTLSIDVQLVGPQIANPVVVGFEVGGSAQEGRDFQLSTDRTVTIPGNASTTRFDIEILNDAAFIEDTVVLVLTIVSATEGIGIGQENEDRKQLTVTIIEDDCAIDWLVGTFDVTTTNTNPSQCDGTTNVVTISQINGTTFQLTDITGGVYKNCFNFSDNPGQLTLDGSRVRLIDQPDVVIGNDQFNGEGDINTCEQTFSLSWSNGFGDRGVSTYQRRN